MINYFFAVVALTPPGKITSVARSSFRPVIVIISPGLAEVGMFDTEGTLPAVMVSEVLDTTSSPLVAINVILPDCERVGTVTTNWFED